MPSLLMAPESSIDQLVMTFSRHMPATVRLLVLNAFDIRPGNKLTIIAGGSFLCCAGKRVYACLHAVDRFCFVRLCFWYTRKASTVPSDGTALCCLS